MAEGPGLYRVEVTSRQFHKTKPELHPRSKLLGAALEYAKRGVQVFPCKANKAPCTQHGFCDAATQPSQITAWWNRWTGASIGVPTGERSGFFVVDVDDLAAYKELVREHGEMPPTWTVKTPSGGFHLYFRHVDGIRNSPGGLPRGIDVRGEGGYVIAPPSPGYEVLERSPITEVPEWLAKLVRERPEAPKEPSRRSERPKAAPGEPIPEGERNRTLFFIALDLKDQGKGVLDELLAINEERCQPPLNSTEVEKIAKSAVRYPIRSGSPSPELVEAVEALIRLWWEFQWRGLGGQSDRDAVRILLELALRYGRLNEDGSVDISASVRTLSIAAAVSYVTVSRGCTKRLEEAGWVTKVHSNDPRKGATWRFHRASQGANTYSIHTILLTVRDTLPDESPTWRHRGLVGKGAGGVEALLEVYGPMSRDQVAEVLGWSNAREVERRYLRKLVDRGLAEKRDDGRYALVGDHAEVVEEIKGTSYAILLRREQWGWDPLTQDWEYEPPQYGAERSEDQRTEADREQHEQHREAHRADLTLRESSEDADEDVVWEELTPATAEMLAANRVGRYLLARGWKRFDKRLWVDPETGEIMPVDRAMEAAMKEVS